MSHQETSLLNFRIPNRLKHDFQVTCVQNGTRMTSELRRMIKDYLRKEVVDEEKYKHSQRKLTSEHTEETHGRFVKDPETGVWETKN